MAIRVESVSPEPFKHRDDITIVWKGGRIARLLFPSGKVICFDLDQDDASSGSLKKSNTPQPPIA